MIFIKMFSFSTTSIYSQLIEFKFIGTIIYETIGFFLSIPSNILPHIVYFKNGGHYVYYSWHLSNQYQQPEEYK